MNDSARRSPTTASSGSQSGLLVCTSEPLSCVLLCTPHSLHRRPASTQHEFATTLRQVRHESTRCPGLVARDACATPQSVSLLVRYRPASRAVSANGAGGAAVSC